VRKQKKRMCSRDEPLVRAEKVRTVGSWTRISGKRSSCNGVLRNWGVKGGRKLFVMREREESGGPQRDQVTEVV